MRHSRFGILVALIIIAFARVEAKCRAQIDDVQGCQLLVFQEGDGCSTNRALGYAIGKEFKENIAARLKLLAPQVEQAIVSLSIPSRVLQLRLGRVQKSSFYINFMRTSRD